MAIKVKCMNENCNNYKQELNEGVEICSLCNTPVTKFETKEKSKLGLAAIIAGLVGFAFTLWGFSMFMLYLGFAGVIAGVILGIISKRMPSIIVSSVSLIAAASVFIWFVFLN